MPKKIRYRVIKHQQNEFNGTEENKKNSNGTIPNQEIMSALTEKNIHIQNSSKFIQQKNIKYHACEKENLSLKELVKDKKMKKEQPNNNIEIQGKTVFEEEIVVIRDSYKLTKDLLEILTRISESESILKKYNNQLNKALQDILHKAESDKFSVVEGYRLAKKAQDIQNQKTLAIDNMNIYKQLSQLNLISNENIHILKNILSEIEREREIVEYLPRVLKDLEFKYDNEKIHERFADISKKDCMLTGIKEL